MTKLIKMKVRAVALVDKGANRRDFFLIKNFKGDSMKKEQVIELLKSAKGVSKDTLISLCKSLPEADQPEVEALIKTMDGAENEEATNDEEEKFIEKVCTKISKSTSDQMKSLQDAVAALQTNLAELMNALKESEEIKETPSKVDPSAEVSEEEFKKMLDEAVKK